MGIQRLRPEVERLAAAAGRRGIRPGRRASNVLLGIGGLLLLGAGLVSAYAGLGNWLMGQDRYLAGDAVAWLAVPTRTATPAPSPTVVPTRTAAPTPSPTPTLTPSPSSPPVQIRIPALGVSRSIIALPGKRDRTGVWTWDTQRLFREGRPDLVGHWTGAANPGETGNTVLVGHNYGYGVNGVFVSLGRLKAGQRVTVVTQDGKTWTYRVTTVKRLTWRRKDFAELTEHLTLLDPGGRERLTLVSCAGADLEPFPERIYVVAEPVR